MMDNITITEENIVITVPISAIPTASQIAWERADPKTVANVTDVHVFAKELVLMLIEEEENGDTLITDMLDKAVIRAIEAGAEGVELTTNDDW